MQTLVSDLRSFKLSGMAFSLEERLIYAQTNYLIGNFWNYYVMMKKVIEKIIITKEGKMQLSFLV